MKIHRLRLFLLSLLTIPAFASEEQKPAPPPAEAVTRDFRGTNGVVIKAAIIDKTETEAVLATRDGKRMKVALDNLVEEDRAYVKSWSKEEDVFLRKCRRLSIRQCLELRGYESFEFRFDGNHIMIDGKVNGKPARMMADTGAHTLLHDGFAKSVSLEVGPMTEKIYGVAGEQEAGWTAVPSFQIGEAVFKDRKILAADMNKDRPPGSKSNYDLLLGADFMNQLDGVISYPEQRIFFRPDRSDEDAAGGSTDFRLFKTKDGKVMRGKVVSKTPTVATLKLVNGRESQMPVSNFIEADQTYLNAWTEEGALFMEHCGGLSVEDILRLRSYQSFQIRRVPHSKHVYVDGTLNDHKVTYCIDTGAFNSLLHIDAAKRYGCDVGPMDQEVWGIGGVQPAAAVKIDKITLGSCVLTNRKLLAADLFRGDATDEDHGWIGLFGGDFMRELEAYITYTEDRFFLIQR
ncbi:MAG: hypothetical protein FJ385_02720 [Verrucomicrobia bacterium]|nr:hypothetical protein [Verrucomicrobiota bacterium]